MKLVSTAIDWAGTTVGKLTKKYTKIQGESAANIDSAETIAVIKGVRGIRGWTDEQLEVVCDNAMALYPDKFRDYKKLITTFGEDRAFYDLAGLDYTKGEIPRIKAGMALAILRENI